MARSHGSHPSSHPPRSRGPAAARWRARCRRRRRGSTPGAPPVPTRPPRPYAAGLTCCRQRGAAAACVWREGRRLWRAARGRRGGRPEGSSRHGRGRRPSQCDRREGPPSPPPPPAQRPRRRTPAACSRRPRVSHPRQPGARPARVSARCSHPRRQSRRCCYWRRCCCCCCCYCCCREPSQVRSLALRRPSQALAPRRKRRLQRPAWASHPPPRRRRARPETRRQASAGVGVARPSAEAGQRLRAAASLEVAAVWRGLALLSCRPDDRGLQRAWEQRPWVVPRI